MSARLHAWLLIVLAVLGVGLHAQASAGAYEDFFVAVATDDASTVQRLLARGFDPNAVDPQGHPAMVAAMREKSWKVANVLIAARTTEVDRPNAQGETALMIAAHHGHLPTVEALLRRGAQPNRPGWTPLHYAASAGHEAVARLLLENSAYIDAESPNGTTPLMMASRQGHSALARWLVEEGADPRPRNQAGLSAADYFERGGDRAAADWMRQQARSFGSGPTGRAASSPAAAAGTPGAGAAATSRGAGAPGAAAAVANGRGTARPGYSGENPSFAGAGPDADAAAPRAPSGDARGAAPSGRPAPSAAGVQGAVGTAIESSRSSGSGASGAVVAPRPSGATAPRLPGQRAAPDS